MTWRELAGKFMTEFTNEQLDQPVMAMFYMSLYKNEDIKLRKTLQNPGHYYLVIEKSEE